MHLRLTSSVPAGQRRSWHRDDAARALDEESVVADQGESSDWLWVMPGLPQARQGTSDAGLIALGADPAVCGRHQCVSTTALSIGALVGRELGL